MSDGRSFERLPPNGRRTAAACDWEVCKFAELSEGRCAGIFARFAATIARWLSSRARCSPCSIRLLFERSPTPSRGDDKPLVKELLASVKQMREATKNQSGQV